MGKECQKKELCKGCLRGIKSVGKPRNISSDDVEIDLKKRGVRGWSKIDKDRDAWKLIVKEARVLHGP